MKRRSFIRVPRKPGQVWAAFAVGVSLVVVAMGWVTAKVIELDDRSQEAVAQAQFEERVRLALWRLDSVAAPIIATEASQPYFAYRAFFPAEGAYKDMFEEPQPGDLLVPSPLLAADNAAVRLHFQIGDDGSVTSPQVPHTAELKKAAGDVLDPATIRAKLGWLANLEQLFKGEYAALLAQLPLQTDHTLGAVVLAGGEDSQADQASRTQARYDLAAEQWRRQQAQVQQQKQRTSGSRPAVAAPVTPSATPPADQANTIPNAIGGEQAIQRQQVALNKSDYQRRLSSYGSGGSSQSAANVYKSGLSNSKKLLQQLRQSTADAKLQAKAAPAPTSPTPQFAAKPAPKPRPKRRSKRRRQQPRSIAIDVELARAQPEQPATAPETPIEGPMTPLWLGDQLFLARKVALGDSAYIQGAWLHWSTVEERLLKSVEDLLPSARLVGVRGEDLRNASQGAPRRLASLPVRLDPGSFTPAGLQGLTPLRLSLLIAWGLLLAGALAVGALLRGALTLSERRGAFVSAVTHELRTPLTTFRMYTEMLAGGMVTEPQKQQRYLDTLHAEAERLGHLVENVLAFAQIERRPDAAKVDHLPLIPLVERLTDRLVQRAEQGGLTLSVTLAAGLQRSECVSADPGAVERVLFNLVDNACKYAATSPPSGGHEPAVGAITLEISTPDSATARIAVRDFGPGIDPDDVATIFRPFHKSAKKAAVSAPGVGLGLALCRRLAIAMGGNLRHETPQDGPGARFVLTLPRVRSKES